MTDLVISRYADVDLVALSVVDDDAALPRETRVLSASLGPVVERAAAEAVGPDTGEIDLDAVLDRVRALSA